MARLIPACAGKTRRLWAWRPPSPAHPRACGENVLAASSASSTPGSSPRVRGKLGAVDARLHTLGIIPARAGKTRPARHRQGPGAAHPRACGENFTRTPAVRSPGGSSPRVRGKQSACSRSEARRRLIPARAGKTSTQDVSTRPWRLIPARAGKTKPRSRIAWLNSAHPRACGENRRRAWESMDSWGSSPRVRGKLWSVRRAGGEPRLIPARAGKTMLRRKSPVYIAAHPRACGENVRGSDTSRRPVGSSPRVRGKRIPPHQGEEARRLIPARAGKTQGGSPVSWIWRAHPRACGENLMSTRVVAATAGSSPRVRGKPGDQGLRLPREGLIPARAGKTSPRPRPRRAAGAHPRACGENRTVLIALSFVAGSSPRVRGKPANPVVHAPLVGLIPARAGKTCAVSATRPR